MARARNDDQFLRFRRQPVGVFAELSGVGGFARDKQHGTRGNGFNVVERVKVHELHVAAQGRVRRGQRRSAPGGEFSARSTVEFIEFPFDRSGFFRKLMDGSAGVLRFSSSSFRIPLFGGFPDDGLALFQAPPMPEAVAVGRSHIVHAYCGNGLQARVNFRGADGETAAAADAEPIVEGSNAFDELAFAVHEVCESLARNIAADGEGASKLVTVNVTGAANDEEADIAARAVANSPLVKTCIAGHDCNWGRVAMALGKCGVKFNQEDVSIDMMGMPVCRNGLTVPFDEDEALRRFEAPEIVISADLGAGDAATTVWTCDLTHEYISINGDYRS